MKKYLKSFLICLLILITLFPAPTVFSARTDDVWSNFGTYIKTNSFLGFDVLINGLNKYLNFGSTSGTSGYGFRDNSGNIEFKDSGGSWADIGSGGGGGTPAGSATEIQINDYGSFGSDSNFTYSTTSDKLTAPNASTTQFTAVRSWLGTVLDGIWNGDPIDISDYTNLTTDTNYIVLDNDNLEFASTTINQFTTGWISGGEPTIDGSDPTKFDVTAGTGIVCDNHTDPTNPSCTVVIWDAFEDQSLNVPGQLVTRIGIDSNGDLVQSFLNPLFTREQQRDYISIGAAIHLTGATIDFFTDSVDVVGFNPSLNLRDAIEALGTTINVSGNIVQEGSSGMELSVTAGNVYAPGSNRANTKDPNFPSFSATSTLNWQYSYRDSTNPPLNFSFTTSTTTLVANRYDDGTGATGSIPNGIVADNRYSVQRAYLLGSTGQWFIEYDQDTHSSFSEASANINEAYSQNDVLGALAFRGWIILKGDATDVTDTDQVRFLNADRFGDNPLNYSIEDGVANMHNFANGANVDGLTATTTVSGGNLLLSVARADGGDENPYE